MWMESGIIKVRTDIHNCVLGQSLGKVHKKDPYREGPVLLIRV